MLGHVGAQGGVDGVEPEPAVDELPGEAGVGHRGDDDVEQPGGGGGGKAKTSVFASPAMSRTSAPLEQPRW